MLKCSYITPLISPNQPSSNPMNCRTLLSIVQSTLLIAACCSASAEPADSRGRFWTPDGVYESSSTGMNAELRSRGGKSLLRAGNDCVLIGTLKKTERGDVYNFSPTEADGMGCPDNLRGRTAVIHVMDGPGVRAAGNASQLRIYHRGQAKRVDFSGTYEFKSEMSSR
jgi:hypothetical protein